MTNERPTRETGTVLWFNAKRQFGFIRRACGCEVFFRLKCLKPTSVVPVAGDVIAFTVHLDDRNRQVALKCRVIIADGHARMTVQELRNLQKIEKQKTCELHVIPEQNPKKGKS